MSAAWWLILVLAGEPGVQAEDLDAQLALGRERLATGDAQGALNAFSAAIRAHPESAAACRGRAQALAALDDPRKATEWALRATGLSPQEPAGWRVLGELYLHPAWRDAPRAEAALRRWLELEPQSPDARLVLARALSFEKKLEEAVAVLQQQVERFPTDRAARVRLAETLYAAGQLARAEVLIGEVLREAPGDADALRVHAAIESRVARNLWIPAVSLILLPGLFLFFQWLRRGRALRLKDEG